MRADTARGPDFGPVKVALVDRVRSAVDPPLAWLSFGLYWFIAAVRAWQHVIPDDPHSLPRWLLALPATLGLFVALRLGRRRTDVKATVGAHGLQLRGRRWEQTIPRKHIASAHVRSGNLGGEVELRLHDRSVLRIETHQPDDAKALVTALGRDAEQRPATMTADGLEGRYGNALLVAFAHAIFFFLVQLLLDLDPAGYTATLALGHVILQALFCFFLIRLIRPAEVTVGSDAVIVQGPFRRRVVPWTRIETIDTSAADVELVLTPPPGAPDKARRKTIRLRTASDYASRTAIVQRLEETRALRDRLADGHLGRRLARQGRSLEDWRADLSSLLESAGDAYRRAAVSVESLRAIASNPTVPAEQRLGAALAIGAARDPEARTAVRIAAQNIVSPKLRVALREAVKENPDEAAIEEALAEEDQSARDAARGAHTA